MLPAEDDQFRDLRITDVSVRQTDFESAPMTVTVMFDAIGLTQEEVKIQLKDLATGKVVEEQSAKLGPEGEAQEVRFRFRPEQSGVSFYEASIFTPRDREAVTQTDENGTAKSGEATLLNNTRIVTVDRATGPYRILYVSGDPIGSSSSCAEPFKRMRKSSSSDSCGSPTKNRSSVFGIVASTAPIRCSPAWAKTKRMRPNSTTNQSSFASA